MNYIEISLNCNVGEIPPHESWSTGYRELHGYGSRGFKIDRIFVERGRYYCRMVFDSDYYEYDYEYILVHGDSESEQMRDVDRELSCINGDYKMIYCFEGEMTFWGTPRRVCLVEKRFIKR